MANLDKNDQTTHMKTFKQGDLIYFHIQISGGEPREEVSLSYEIVDEEDRKTTGEWTRVSDNGMGCWQCIEYDSTDISGTVTLTIYDSNQKVLGEQSVKIK